MNTAAATPSREYPSDLRALREVVEGPLIEIAARFSRYLSARWPHQALLIYTLECTGRPRKVSGPPEIVDRATIAELEALKSGIDASGRYFGSAQLAGEQRWVWALRDTRDASDTLLVLVPRARTALPDAAGLGAAFGLVATSIRQQVAQASPDYLAESRAASTERARIIAELTAAQEAVLAGILAPLRSTALDDRGARMSAAQVASTAMIALRRRLESDRAMSGEPPADAFDRLRREVEPLLRHQGVTAEFAGPNPDGPRIPGEVAHGARAISYSLVLAFAAQPQVRRLRIAWADDRGALSIDIRDHGDGGLDAEALERGLDGRLRTLRAELDLELVTGWGSRVLVRIPLDPPPVAADQSRLAALSRREREVLALVANGKRNKTIAGELGIAESTVKFHVAGLLDKLGVGTRGEAAALGLQAGIARLGRPDIN